MLPQPNARLARPFLTGTRHQVSGRDRISGTYRQAAACTSTSRINKLPLSDQPPGDLQKLDRAVSYEESWSQLTALFAESAQRTTGQFAPEFWQGLPVHFQASGQARHQKAACRLFPICNRHFPR